MADRGSFLRAIRANPDDGTLRLVFADWLDERDDPLGQFIRVQIELDPIRGQLDSPRVRELLDREADLLGRHGPRWVGRMIDLDDAHPGFGPVFRRGLPELVCLSLDNFLARGGELFEDCPTVREVSIYGVAGRGAELAACPHLAHVETLELADWISPEYGSPLVQAVDGSRIRRLKYWWFESDQGYCVTNFARRTSWPGSIEIIVFSQDVGGSSGTEAEVIDELRGRRAACVTRPDAALFPLMGYLGRGLFAGRNEDGLAMLLAVAADSSGCWVSFDENGEVEDVSTFGSIDPAESEEWRATHSGLIRVRGFETIHGQLSIRLWPRSYVTNYLRHPLDRPAGWTDEAWSNRGGVLRRWLQQGRFVIEWDGHEFWADSSGTIFSS